jgi:hypothetical protein
MSKGKWLVVLGIVALTVLMMVAVSSAQVGNPRAGATVGPALGNLQLNPAILQNLSENTVQLFGHVTLVNGYDSDMYKGCHALIKLRGENKTIAVLTEAHHMQTLMESALVGNKLVSVHAFKYSIPPTVSPGSWNPGLEVYLLERAILYNMH